MFLKAGSDWFGRGEEWIACTEMKQTTAAKSIAEPVEEKPRENLLGTENSANERE